MPLDAAVRYLGPGAVAGIVSFAFSRVMIEPLIGAAVEYEGEREHALAGGGHEHGHELFTRAVQENVGAAVGVVVFGTVMGVLFALAYTVLEHRGIRPDPTGVALSLSAGMFVAISLIPSLKYPANPPGVGLDDTVGERSSAFLMITAVSVVGACVAVGVGLAWARRWGAWRATAVAFGGYVAVMLCTMVLLPSFDEVPGPVAGPDGLVLGGFPADVLADFRVYSLLNQAIMWLVIGATSACLMRADRKAVRLVH